MSNSKPPWSHLGPSSAPQEYLQHFIDDEDRACAQRERGDFFPSYHHRIRPLVARAPRLLPRDRRVALYFHLLRLDQCPAIKSAEEFPLLTEAYTCVEPLFVQGYPVCLLQRPKGLYLFGTNDQGPLDAEPVVSHADYLASFPFWRYAESFWHMPGMLQKQQKFLALSQDEALVRRVTKVVLRTHPVDDLTTRTCLWFWALVLLVLQQQEPGAAVVEWFLRFECRESARRELLAILSRYLRASSRTDLLPRVESEQGPQDEDA